MTLDQIDAAIETLLKEKDMLISLKGAINPLTFRLDGITRYLRSSSNNLSGGGLIINGVGVDCAVYGGSGLSGYGDSKIVPLSAAFKSVVSEIDIVIDEYDNLLSQLYTERSKTLNEADEAVLENRLEASRRRDVEASRRIPIKRNSSNRTNPRVLRM